MSYILHSIHELKKLDGETLNPIRFVSIKKIQNSSSSSKVWLISFTDILALMLTFFVMLYSMSEHNIDQQKPINNKIVGVENIDQNQLQGARDQAGAVDDISLNKISFNRALDLGYLQNILETYRDENINLKDMQISRDEKNGRIILILPEELLFASGQSNPSSRGMKSLGQLAKILSNIKNGVEVIGHSDPRATRDGKSNLLLSLERAQAVAGVLEAQGYENGINFQGYGSALFDSLPSTWDDSRKLSTARRVDIVVHAHDGSRLKRFGIAAP
jgi:chemotaxis protein MotB